MVQSRQEILKQIEAHLPEIRRFGVCRLGLFGSAARGDNTADSDLDFVVEFRVKSFDSYMDLKFYLEDLFGRPVDLVLSNTIKPRLRERIATELVYAEGL